MPPSLPSATPSRTATPNPTILSNFTSQTSTAEDLLKSQTVGLVHLSDFRKRRAEALEQKEREAEDRSLGRISHTRGSGSATPATDDTSTPQAHRKKKKHKAALGKLSFGVEDEETTVEDDARDRPSPVTETDEANNATSIATSSAQGDHGQKKRLGANTTVQFMPKVLTKSTLLREAQMREQLRKEFLTMQKSVRATDMVIPFVFYDGTNIPGGLCKVKKGEHVWLFLDNARKVGAERGIGGAGERASSKREWARVGVDDLLLVRGEIIIPHHYEFYYFIANKTRSPAGGLLFDYSSQPTTHSPPLDPSADLADYYDPRTVKPSARRRVRRGPGGISGTVTVVDNTLEGVHDEPTMTKVVDRRWYERNKHIFPASVWEAFDPEKDYSQTIRRDNGGNAFFFT